MSELHSQFNAIIEESGGSLAGVPLWRHLFEDAEDELARTQPGGYDVEDIGRLAWDRLTDAEKPGALDALVYAYWSASMAEVEEMARAKQVAAGSFLEPSDWRQLRIDLVGQADESMVTVTRMPLERVMAELERLQSALAATGGVS